MVIWESAESSLFDVDFFKPTKDDRKLITLLLNEALAGEEKKAAQIRLCEIAVVDGCLDVRTALGTLAGLTPEDVDAFTKSIGTPIDRAMGAVGLSHIIGIASDAIVAGDIDKCTLIAASVGYYPPESLFQAISSIYTI